MQNGKYIISVDKIESIRIAFFIMRFIDIGKKIEFVSF